MFRKTRNGELGKGGGNDSVVIVKRNGSTIEEVRVAERKVKEVLDTLKKANSKDQDPQARLAAELRSARDEYSKAVLRLSPE